MTVLTNAEIDRKCAELMGWHANDEGYYLDATDCATIWAENGWDDDFGYWHPSTDLNQAWQVVEEKLHGRGITIDICDDTDTETKDYQANIYFGGFGGEDIASKLIRDTSLSRAICLAVLQAWEK